MPKRAAWEEKLAHAGNEADAILQQAKTNAERRSDSIVEDARREAEGILRRAEKDAALERKKAEAASCRSWRRFRRACGKAAGA